MRLLRGLCKKTAFKKSLFFVPYFLAGNYGNWKKERLCHHNPPFAFTRTQQAAPVHKRDVVVGVVARRGEQAPQPHHDKLPALEHGLHALAHPLGRAVDEDLAGAPC